MSKKEKKSWYDVAVKKPDIFTSNRAVSNKDNPNSPVHLLIRLALCPAGPRFLYIISSCKGVGLVSSENPFAAKHFIYLLISFFALNCGSGAH